MGAPRIVAIGDNCVDIYTTHGQVFPGGGALNFAVHATRLGVPAGYVGVVGDDRHGAQLRAALVAEGVDTTCLRTVGGATARAWVRLDGGDRAFLGRDPGVRYQLRVDAAVERYVAGADWVHTTLDGRMEAHLPRWKAAGLRISFDFSHRATPEQLTLLPVVDVAFFSGQKIGPAVAEAAARAWHGRGTGVVVVTLGEHGSLAFDGITVRRRPAEPVQVVDTLGAGDAFMAAFVVRYRHDGDIQAALAAGARAAAAVCGYFGAFGHGAVLDDPIEAAAPAARPAPRGSPPLMPAAGGGMRRGDPRTQTERQ